MHSISLARILLPALISCLAVAACSRKEPAPAADAAPAPPSAPVNVDRLDPLEIPEGNEKAFGLTIPRGMTIVYSGAEEIDAEGPYSAERMANYVRKRVKVDGVELGAARTVFDHGRVLGDMTGRTVRVEVVTVEFGSKLVVKNLTPTKILDPQLTPEERLRQYGLDPKGNPIDPSRQQ